MRYHGGWSACRNGKCSCSVVMCNDYPVATVTRGEWGDEYPAIRYVENDGMPETSVEAYMRRECYGVVSEETARANMLLIAAAPDLYATLERAAYCIRTGADAFETLGCIEQALSRARHGDERRTPTDLVAMIRTPH